MAKRGYAAQVGAWARKTNMRITFVIMESAQRIAEIAQTPGPSVANPDASKGGLLPVDQAFLRSTFSAKIGAMPSGPREFTGNSLRDWEPSVTLTISRVRPGDVIFMGWSAGYARKMEEFYGFMKAAAKQWRVVVRDVVKDAKDRIK